MMRLPVIMGLVGVIAMGAVAAPRRKAAPKTQPTKKHPTSHEEIAPLKVKFGRLSALKIRRDGSLLASDSKAREIKVISPAGKQTGVMKPPFGVESIDVGPDGTIYCGGEGKIAKLDAAGTVIKTVDVPKGAGSAISKESKRRADLCKVTLRIRVTGVAVTDKDVFVAFGSGWSTISTSKLYRFDRDLGSPKLLAEGLRGCCQRCDIAVVNGAVHVAENSRHRIVRYDREGKVLATWGRRSRQDVEGFGACCNPMNLCFDGGGVLYTAESGLARVKRYTADGKFLGVAGYLGVTRFTRAGPLAASCSNMAVAVAPDGVRIYVMDYSNNIIRVLRKKPS